MAFLEVGGGNCTFATVRFLNINLSVKNEDPFTEFRNVLAKLSHCYTSSLTLGPLELEATTEPSTGCGKRGRGTHSY